MNARAARLIAGERERWALAGDELFVRPQPGRGRPAGRGTRLAVAAR